MDWGTGAPGSTLLCSRRWPGFRVGEGTADGTWRVSHHTCFPPLFLSPVTPRATFRLLNTTSDGQV